MESKLQVNGPLMMKLKNLRKSVLFQCDVLIQMLLDTKESVNNNSIGNHHVKAFHNLLYQATIDCHLLSQAASEIATELKELDNKLKSK